MVACRRIPHQAVRSTARIPDRASGHSVFVCPDFKDSSANTVYTSMHSLVLVKSLLCYRRAGGITQKFWVAGRKCMFHL